MGWEAAAVQWCYYCLYLNLKLLQFLNLILIREKSSCLYVHFSCYGVKLRSMRWLKEGNHNFGIIFLIVIEEKPYHLLLSLSSPKEDLYIFYHWRLTYPGFHFNYPCRLLACKCLLCKSWRICICYEWELNINVPRFT